MLLGEGDLGGRSPQPVEVVEFPNAGKKHVHHEIAVIEKDPPSFPDSLDPQRPHPVLPERFLDVMGGGRNLPGGRPRAEEEGAGGAGSGPAPERGRRTKSHAERSSSYRCHVDTSAKESAPITKRICASGRARRKSSTVRSEE